MGGRVLSECAANGEQLLRGLPESEGRKRGETNAMLLAAMGQDAMRDYVMRDYLRAYVDEWISTGKSEDGMEKPRARKLSKTKQAVDAVQRWSGASIASLGTKSTGITAFSGSG